MAGEGFRSSFVVLCRLLLCEGCPLRYCIAHFDICFSGSSIGSRRRQALRRFTISFQLGQMQRSVVSVLGLLGVFVYTLSKSRSVIQIPVGCAGKPCASCSVFGPCRPAYTVQYGYIQSDRLLSWQHFPVPVHDSCQFSKPELCSVLHAKQDNAWLRADVGRQSLKHGHEHLKLQGMSCCAHALSAFVVQPVHACTCTSAACVATCYAQVQLKLCSTRATDPPLLVHPVPPQERHVSFCRPACRRSKLGYGTSM